MSDTFYRALNTVMSIKVAKFGPSLYDELVLVTTGLTPNECKVIARLHQQQWAKAMEENTATTCIEDNVHIAPVSPTSSSYSEQDEYMIKS